jgi:hypothetical protein
MSKTRRSGVGVRPGRNGNDYPPPECYPADQIGEANEDVIPELAPGPAEEAPSFRFEFLESSAFDKAEYKLEWLVRRLLVKGQPAVLGGPKKSLKTSLIVDLAISLGTGSAFLGTFGVERPVRVGVLSGESGESVLQETARRVSSAKGVELAGADVLWGFRLPQLADAAHLLALREAVEANRLQVLLLDPL